MDVVLYFFLPVFGVALFCAIGGEIVDWIVRRWL